MASEIRRLLDLAERRRKALDSIEIAFKVDRAKGYAFKSLLMSDGVSMTEICRALVDGYLRREPAILALVDQAQSDERRDRNIAPKRKELPGIYAEIGSGMITDEQD